MRIAIIIKQPGFLRYIQTQVEALCAQGHHVHVGVQDLPINDEDGLLEYFTRRYSTVSIGHAVSRADRWARISSSLRSALDYAHYLYPDFARARALKDRSHKTTSQLGRALSRAARLAGVGRSRTLTALYLRLLRSIYASIPIDPDIRTYLRQLDPDLVLCTGLVWPRSAQADYVLACRELGVPTGYIVNSWDNLTNKGDVKAAPDVIYVWNKQQAEEARKLHGMSPNSICVTGAPLFDRWFDRPITESRADFCRRVGLPDDKPFLLYVGSSPAIAPQNSEIGFFQRWHAALRGDPRLNQLNVLARPHPFNVRPWDSLDVDDVRLAVHPRHGRWIAREEDREDYFHALAHCAGVIGINTSAMLEAAVVGARTFTLQTGDFADTQDGTLHFHYLTQLGIVETHAVFAPHFDALAKVACAPTPSGRRPPLAGVEPFVRPAGIDRSSTEIAVAAINAQVNRRKARRLGLQIWQPLLFAALALRMAFTRAPQEKKSLKQAYPRPTKGSSFNYWFERHIFPRLLKASLKFLPRDRRLLRRVLVQQLSEGEQRRLISVDGTLTEVARSKGSILVGPWISEVGFEVLYWIPFLRWAVTEFRIDPERLVILSRGGVAGWYDGLGSRYVEIFDLFTPQEFKARNDERVAQLGHQKQSQRSDFEREICQRAAAQLGLQRYTPLHPSAMFELYTRFWKDISGFRLMEQTSKFEHLATDPDLDQYVRDNLPPRYIVVKFYFRESLPDTPRNREQMAKVIRHMAQYTDVVLLSSDIQVDDHLDFKPELSVRIHRVDAMLDPSRNLALQTAIIARSDAYVGTYGGMTYVANYLGKTSFCFEDVSQLNRPMHTELANRKLNAFGGRLYLLHIDDLLPFAQMFAHALDEERTQSDKIRQLTS